MKVLTNIKYFRIMYTGYSGKPHSKNDSMNKFTSFSNKKQGIFCYKNKIGRKPWLYLMSFMETREK